MIYIFAPKNSETIKLLSNWLNYFNKDFLVINSLENIEKLHLIRKRNVKNNAIWIWKNFMISNIKPRDLRVFINYENQSYINYFIRSIPRENRLGNLFELMEIEKLYQLEIAYKLGFKIPKTEIVSTRVELNKFICKFENIITKPLSDGFVINNNDIFGKIYTNKVKISDKIPLRFQPSLIQEFIDFQYEIRVIFIEKELYPVAIFKNKSKNDIKEYSIKELRCVPYNLNNEIKEKIYSIIDFFDLNFGSIDLLFSKIYGYVFLEINPAGVFDYYSIICNYKIHKKIALWLKEKIK